MNNIKCFHCRGKKSVNSKKIYCFLMFISIPYDSTIYSNLGSRTSK